MAFIRYGTDGVQATVSYLELLSVTGLQKLVVLGHIYLSSIGNMLAWKVAYLVSLMLLLAAGFYWNRRHKQVLEGMLLLLSILLMSIVALLPHLQSQWMGPGEGMRLLYSASAWLALLMAVIWPGYQKVYIRHGLF